MQDATGPEQTFSCHLATPAPSKESSEGIGNCTPLSPKCVADRIPFQLCGACGGRPRKFPPLGAAEGMPLKQVIPSSVRQKFIAKLRHPPGEPQPLPLVGIRPSLFTLRLLSWKLGRS